MRLFPRILDISHVFLGHDLGDSAPHGQYSKQTSQSPKLNPIVTTSFESKPNLPLLCHTFSGAPLPPGRMTACSPTEMPEFSCSTCHKSFKRKEHRDRHQLSHTTARPFFCPLCNYRFTRKDALMRHVRLHAARDSSTAGSPTPRITAACDNCAIIKARCSEQKPCLTCQHLQLSCTTTHQKKRRGQV
jgi:uncharacterized Zn-finger protein